MKAWSYLGTYGHHLPYVGTFHTLDLVHLFYGTDDICQSMQTRHIAFVNSLDPNEGRKFAPPGFQTEWLLWKEGKTLLEFGTKSTALLEDDVREESYVFIRDNLEHLRY
jgi:hypothetical protein